LFDVVQQALIDQARPRGSLLDLGVLPCAVPVTTIKLPSKVIVKEEFPCREISRVDIPLARHFFRRIIYFAVRE